MKEAIELGFINPMTYFPDYTAPKSEIPADTHGLVFASDLYQATAWWNAVPLSSEKQ